MAKATLKLRVASVLIRYKLVTDWAPDEGGVHLEVVAQRTEKKSAKERKVAEGDSDSKVLQEVRIQVRDPSKEMLATFEKSGGTVTVTFESS